MRNWKILCLLTLSSLFRLTSALGQCNITPDLTGASIYSQSGNNNDYIVVCTQGAATGALLVQNGISAGFLSFFDSYVIDWGDNSANFTTTSDDFTAPPATHIYTVGTYVLTFSATGLNCTVTHTYNVYVGNTPSVSMGTPGGTEGCSEVTIAFPVSNADNNIPTTVYEVTFSDGGVTQNFNQPPPATVSHTFNESSCGESFNGLNNSYGVTITATNECGQAQVSVAPIRISDPPVADFIPSAETICTTGVVTFDDTSNPGTTATQNGCNSNAKFYWTISPASGWNVTSGIMGSNNGLPDNFTIWTPGTDQIGVNFTTPGTYDVTIHYRNGCGPSEHTETICVIEPPVCDFDVNNSSGCGPLTVITDNNTIAPECNGNDLNLNYDWEIIVSGGGSYTITSGSLTSVNPTFNFTNTTTSTLVYTINLTVTPVNPQTGQEMTSCLSTCTQNITVYPAPVISTNPTPNQSICVGGTPGLLTVAYQYGVGTPIYQWYSNTINSNTGGTIINGANSTNYQPPTLNSAGNVYYYAVISLGGNCGTISSNPACVSVAADPTISNQPLATQTICSGGTAVSLAMTYANGTGTATYQWYSNTSSATTGGTSVAGATNASFTPSVPTTPGTYYYYGIVTLSGSGCSSATTASAAVQVIADPVVIINTLSYTYCQNATSVPITATVTGGNGTNGFQWYQTGSAVNSGGTALTGQTSSSFTPPTTTVGTQYYYVQVSQSTSGCSSPSQPIAVIILPAASFSTQPQPSTVCVGGVPNTLSATFINGTGTPSYQWYSSPNSIGTNGTAIIGATSPNYTPPTATVGTIYYYVIITFSEGGCANITSNTTEVTVVADPSLTINPGTSQELCVGGIIPTPLSITVSGGTGTYDYQWYSNSTSSNSGGTIINGATNTSYTPPAFTASGSFFYYASVSASGSGCNLSPSATTNVIVVNDPVVTSQPLPVQEICQNAPTTPIAATVSGGSGISSYTWYSSTTNTTTGGTQVSTSNPFTPPTSTVGELYYYAIISQSGSGCSVTTATAQVIVTPAASFISQPQGSTVCVNGVATVLSVDVSNGLGTPNYQWYTSSNSSGTPSTAISGATYSTFTPPTSVAGNLYYYVVVSFSGGNCSNITSNTALVSVVADPTISLQPATPQTVCQGNALVSELSFTVAGGIGNSSYQWYSNTTASTSGGVAISNATSTNYNPPVFIALGTYYYYASASASGNGCESTTTTVITVTVNPAATASATGPYTTCGTTAVPILAVSSGSGTWSVAPISGTFATSTNANTTFTPNSGTAQNITLTWTTSDPDGSGPCPSVSASTVLTVFPPATASLSATSNLCSNQTLPITATTNALGTWSTTGNGIFNPGNSASTAYTPGTNDVSNSPITLTWTTTDPDGAGPCISVSASQTVSITSPPIVSAGADQTLCLNSPAIILNGTPAGGTWAGNGVTPAGNFNPVIMGVFNLTYTYSDSNGCSSFDEVTINVNQSATAEANGPYIVCGINPVNINAVTNGTGTWIGGAGTFMNAASPSTTYTPALIELGTTIDLTWTTFDPDNTGPCAGASDMAQLTINIPAAATPGGPYTICSSDVVSISVTSSPTGGFWTGGLGTFASTTNSNTTYTPTSAESGNTILLNWTTNDPDNSGPCPSVTVQVSVNILEAAIAEANGPYFICGIEPVILNATTNGAGEWSGGAGLFADSSNPSTTYTPTPSEEGETIQITWETFDPDGNGPCPGDSDSVELTISTPATATPGGPYAICSNGTASIEVVTTPGGGNWSGGAGDFADASDPSTIYTPLSLEGGSTVYLEWQTIDPDDSGPCPVVTATVEVNILEQAIASIEGPFEVCANGNVLITAISNGPGEWSMNPSNLGSLADNASSSTTFTPLVADLYTNNEVTVEWITFDPDGDGPCNAFNTTDIITINALPVVTLQSNYSIDCGDVISASVTGGSGTGYTYQWSPSIGLIDPQSISTSVNASGLYQITITDDNGCAENAETNVSITALDQMTQAEDAETCLLETVELNGQAIMGAAPFTYLWTPAANLDPADGESDTVNFLYSQYLDQDTIFTYTLSITDALGCSDNETVLVTVHPLPEVNAGPDMEYCADEPSFELTGFSPDPQTGLSASWSPSSTVDPGTLPIGDNAFTYGFTDLNGCYNSDTRTVTIYEVPVAEFQYPTAACEGAPVLFNNQTICGTCGTLQYHWLFGNGLGESISTSPFFTFSDTGNVAVTLIVQSSFGCIDSITHTIQILALPETSFLLSGNVGCGPLDIDITNTTVGAGLTYTWNIEGYGVTSVAQPGTITFPLAPCDSIFYQIYLEAENICGISTYEDEVLVYNPPQPEFNMSSDTICSSLPIALYNSTACAWQTTYTWDFGEGTEFNSDELIIDYVYYAFDAFAQYDITLSAENQCGIVDNTQTITVVPNSIDAFFTADPVNGCEPLPVSFDQEMSGVTYFAWDFGDGSTSLEDDPLHIYQNDGSYQVSFIAGNFCGAQDTAYQFISVLAAPEFDFTSSDDYLCIGESTTFTAFGDPIYGYQWAFGDGSTSTFTSPSYTYQASGEYEVSLTALSSENGCPTTVTNIIEVITTPTAEIIADSLAGCPPFMVNFTNNSTEATMYFWNLDDGTSYIGDSLQHTFESSGMYSVEVIAVNSNSCADTAIVNVTVYPSPIAAFSYTTSDDATELGVFFDNESQNAIAYEWDFGDGEISYSINPFHSYQKDGDCDYSPTLLAYNSFGCTDLASEDIKIPFELIVYAPNSFTPNNDNLNDAFIVYTQDVDPLLSHLQIFDRWGVMVHEAKGTNPSWDGIVNNKLATNDAFVWIYNTRKKCGIEDVEFKGHVIVIR